MTVNESTIPVGDTGKLLDSTTVIHDDGTEAEREGVFIGDPGIAGQRLRLLLPSDANESDVAVPVRSFQATEQIELLGDILNELKTMNQHLQSITDEEF